MTSTQHADTPKRDLLTRPIIAVGLWGVPLAMGWGADAVFHPGPLTDVIWAVALAWMGGGCALNAWECHRLHCYLAAPILFLGAAGMAAVAVGFAPLGVRTASLVINVSLGLALLTFIAEPVWGKYRHRSRDEEE